MVSAENLKSPSVPLLQRGKNSEPNELIELKFSILSTVWRRFQEIRYAVRSELPWLHFCHSRAGGNPAIVGCGDEGTASFAIDAVRKLTTSYGSFTSFPRRRESSQKNIPRRGQKPNVAPQCGGFLAQLDSRLRGNDETL
jgi:hypothetical protein